jgi:predicted amidophosphoribosyltransferase
MRAAPPLNCAHCGRRIGKTAGHFLTEGERLLCSRCLTKTVHAELFPDCPKRWHDPLDHLECTGTRAGIAHRLGLWP